MNVLKIKPAYLNTFGAYCLRKIKSTLFSNYQKKTLAKPLHGNVMKLLFINKMLQKMRKVRKSLLGPCSVKFYDFSINKN